MMEVVELLSKYGDVKCTFEVEGLHRVSFILKRVI